MECFLTNIIENKSNSAQKNERSFERRIFICNDYGGMWYKSRKQVSGMASGDQIKSLLNAYYNRDENYFKTVALQIAVKREQVMQHWHKFVVF